MQLTTKKRGQLRSGIDVYLCRGVSAPAVIEIKILPVIFSCEELKDREAKRLGSDYKYRISEEKNEFRRGISERRRSWLQKFLEKIFNLL